MAIRAVMRSVFSHILGLDYSDNLVIGGNLIYYGNRADNVTPQGYVDLSQLASGGSLFLNRTTGVTLGAGPFHNLGASQIATYVSGTSNFITVAAASGGTTIGGVDMRGASDGFAFVLRNSSTTDNLIFTHNDGSATYPFLNDSAGSEVIPPLGRAIVYYEAGVGLMFL